MNSELDELFKNSTEDFLFYYETEKEFSVYNSTIIFQRKPEQDFDDRKEALMADAVVDQFTTMTGIALSSVKTLRSETF